MRIAVAYKDGEIFEHFGHCECFAIYEYGDVVEDCTKTLVDCADRHGHKAMADLMREQQVDAVLCGNMGSEARALLLLQENGIIKLRDGAGITATKNDIVENPYNVEIVEAEAARLPDMLKDADYAVINSNYAINAGLNPVKDSLAIEGSSSAYANILAVKEGNENTPKILALKAALESRQVASFIESKYNGSVVSTVTNPGNGYDDSVDYDALKGQTITVAASPTPHAEILEVAKEILAAKGITLDIQVYNDYVVPNTVVDDGTLDANYFQHLPYLEDCHAENNTHIVSVSASHVEPMGLYGGLQTSLDALKASK